MRLIEFIDKKVEEQQDEDYPRPVEELKKLIGVVEQQKDFMESLAKQAQKITTEIKYDDTVSGIVVRIQGLVEQIKFDDRGYKSEIESAISDAQEAMNALESAVYAIDEPFKYLLRDLDNQLTELEYEMDEHKWKRESVDPKKMPKPRDPNWKTMQAKGTSGAAGAHTSKKFTRKEKHKKQPEQASEGWKGTAAGAALAAANLLGSPAQAAEEPVKPITIAYVMIDGEVRKYNLGDKFSNAKEAEKFISGVLDKQGLQGYQLEIKHGYPKKKDVQEGYGRYWCSTDKKWKQRKGPKQTRA